MPKFGSYGNNPNLPKRMHGGTKKPKMVTGGAAFKKGYKSMTGKGGSPVQLKAKNHSGGDAERKGK